MAAICRDEVEIIQGDPFLSIPGNNDPANLEATAIREALALAADLNPCRLVIASDCLDAGRRTWLIDSLDVIIVPQTV